jgi:quercetin dioxygenase-like cupin family protein
MTNFNIPSTRSSYAWIPSRLMPSAARSPALLAQAAEKAPALQWGPAPPVFPKGAKMAVVSGDPSQAQPFEVQLSFPNDYRVPPHFHPTDETVEVKKGTFLVGMGDKFDLKQTKPMKKGD